MPVYRIFAAAIRQKFEFSGNRLKIQRIPPVAAISG